MKTSTIHFKKILLLIAFCMGMFGLGHVYTQQPFALKQHPSYHVHPDSVVTDIPWGCDKCGYSCYHTGICPHDSTPLVPVNYYYCPRCHWASRSASDLCAKCGGKLVLFKLPVSPAGTHPTNNNTPVKK